MYETTEQFLLLVFEDKKESGPPDSQLRPAISNPCNHQPAEKNWQTVEQAVVASVLPLSLFISTTNRFLAHSSLLTGLWVCHVPCALIEGGSCGWAHTLTWTSSALLDYKWNIDIAEQPPHGTECGVEWVWRTLELSSVVATRVHQPLSYLAALTVCDSPAGVFTSHRMIYILPLGSSNCGFKKKISYILTGWCCRGALCGWGSSGAAFRGMRTWKWDFRPSKYYHTFSPVWGAIFAPFTAALSSVWIKVNFLLPCVNKAMWIIIHVCFCVTENKAV